MRIVYVNFVVCRIAVGKLARVECNFLSLSPRAKVEWRHCVVASTMRLNVICVCVCVLGVCDV